MKSNSTARCVLAVFVAAVGAFAVGAEAQGENSPTKSEILRVPVPVPADQQLWTSTKDFFPLGETQLTRLTSDLSKPETRLAALSQLLGCLQSARFAGNNDDSPERQLFRKASQAVTTLEEMGAVVTLLALQLDQADKRISALAALIRIAANGPQYHGSVFFGGTGKPAFDNAARAAGLSANRAVTPELITQALDHSDRDIRWWALRHFGSDKFSREAWMPLLPRIERVATEEDSGLRAMAAERLKWFPSSRKFLIERLHLEPSADVLMQLSLALRSGVDDVYQREFLDLFYPLLTNPYALVRTRALHFIESDRGRAPMWQFPYDRRIFDQVVKLTDSEQPSERAAAAGALVEIQGLDRDLSRNILLRLARDSESHVRSNAGRGLAQQREQPEAKAALEVLLQDPVPLVQWRIIISLGPDQHEAQLKRLTQSEDKTMANLAAQTLRGVESRKRRN